MPACLACLAHLPYLQILTCLLRNKGDSAVEVSPRQESLSLEASCSYHTGSSSREMVLLLQSGQCRLGFDPMVLRDLERFSHILFFFKKNSF